MLGCPRDSRARTDPTVRATGARSATDFIRFPDDADGVRMGLPAKVRGLGVSQSALRSRREPAEQAAQLYQAGLAENSAGRPLRALRVLNRALRIVDRPAVVIDASGIALVNRIRLAMSTSESELRGLDRGLSILDAVRASVAETGDRSVEVLLELHLGYMRARGGKLREGLGHLDTAVELLPYADMRSGCNILLNRGMVRVFLGDLRGARTDYERAVALAVEHGLLVEEVKARHNLGELEFFAGNHARALRLMDGAASLSAEVSSAVAFVDRARVLMEAGLYQEADDTLQEADRLFRADRLWKDVGEVELARAQCALSSGAVPAARRLAASARNRFRRRGNDRWRRDAELLLIQADLSDARPGSRLARPALRLAAEFADEGLPARSRIALLLASEALLRTGAVERAAAVVADAGPVRPTDSISVRLHTRLVRAQLRIARGDRSGARHEIKSGLAALAGHQARFGSIDLQTAGAVHGRQLAELDLALALASGIPGSVFTSVERSRATSNRLVAVRAPADPEIADLLAELRSVTSELNQAESDRAAGARAFALRRRSTEIQQLLRSRSWRSEGSGFARQPATLPMVRDRLTAQGTVLVCLVESRGQLIGLVIGSGRSRLVELGSVAQVNEQRMRVRADLDVLANDRFPSALLGSVRGSARRSLHSLDDQLLRPLRLTEGRVVIVPTGTLTTLTWGLLPSLRHRPVVVSPSATAWLAADEAAVGPSRGVAAFAGPALLRAEHEVREVGQVWAGARVFSGQKATTARLREALTTASVVHIATHGQHQTENPLFSSLSLVDGPVWAYELDQSHRPAEHVVLSACDAGQVTVRPGDEGLGLTSVLLRLGCSSVISGVAKVHDSAAHDLMIDYHRRLARGLDSAEALAAASAASEDLVPFVCFGSAYRAGLRRA
jgi:tetratricopeptide (TPR) repeat protein